MIYVKKLVPDAIIPKSQTIGSAGFDLYANHNQYISTKDWSVIRTGVALDMSDDPELVGFVCSRSGLAAKNGIFVLNSPGIIDSDYRGEIMVILANLGNESYHVQKNDRIAQLVFTRHENIINFTETIELSESERGTSGLGSTGK